MPIPIPGGLGDTAEGFEVLPKGPYVVEVTGAEERESTGEGKTPKGTPYIALEFTVRDEEYEGRHVWMNMFFSEKSLPITKQGLRALGYDDERFNDPELTVDPDEFIGQRCVAVVSVGVNPKTEEANNSVRRILPLSAADSELPD